MCEISEPRDTGQVLLSLAHPAWLRAKDAGAEPMVRRRSSEGQRFSFLVPPLKRTAYVELSLANVA